MDAGVECRVPEKKQSVGKTSLCACHRNPPSVCWEHFSWAGITKQGVSHAMSVPGAKKNPQNCICGLCGVTAECSDTKVVLKWNGVGWVQLFRNPFFLTPFPCESLQIWFAVVTEVFC